MLRREPTVGERDEEQPVVGMVSIAGGEVTLAELMEELPHLLTLQKASGGKSCLRRTRAWPISSTVDVRLLSFSSACRRPLSTCEAASSRAPERWRPTRSSPAGLAV